MSIGDVAKMNQVTLILYLSGSIFSGVASHYTHPLTKERYISDLQ